MKFIFTDSPRDCKICHIVQGAVYIINDSEGNQILINEVGMEDLPPGDYCIHAWKIIDNENMFWGEEAFTVPEVAPEKPDNVWPPQVWDIRVTVYLETVSIPPETEGLPITPCEDMWNYEDEGDASWLLLLILLLIMRGA